MPTRTQGRSESLEQLNSFLHTIPSRVEERTLPPGQSLIYKIRKMTRAQKVGYGLAGGATLLVLAPLLFGSPVVADWEFDDILLRNTKEVEMMILLEGGDMLMFEVSVSPISSGAREDI